jgi:phosphonatase-like hydrolase
MNNIELIVFDLSGTTVEDFAQVPDAFTAALAEYGIEVTPEQLNRVRGSSKRQAVLQFIPEGPGRTSKAEKVYLSFRNHLARRYIDGGVRSIAGASETFQWLKERRVRIALNTGFDRDITSLLLNALGWNENTVDAVVCGDDVRHGRPAPYLIFRAMELTGATSVHRVANVGDTALDLQAGNNAGVYWNIGVMSGVHDRKMLENVPHTHLLPSVAEVPSLFSTFINSVI